MKKLIAVIALLTISGCVRQVDLDSWVGQPVIALETHPIFLSIPVVKTQASDGTEIWNYVNSVNIGHCSGGGSIYGGLVDYGTYTAYSNCVQRAGACNNIFFIRDGKIIKYTPIGSGGVRCYTTKKLQPEYSGATNIR